jgi:hypothetical protein
VQFEFIYLFINIICKIKIVVYVTFFSIFYKAFILGVSSKIVAARTVGVCEKEE